jgi:hypothetical protein
MGQYITTNLGSVPPSSAVTVTVHIATLVLSAELLAVIVAVPGA